MQLDRNHLMRMVFPDIEQRCMQRGLPFVPVDLRWGVTEEEAENGEALDICLSEIDACRPFFLCLLGERYGWTPLPPEISTEFAARLPADEAQWLAEGYYLEPGSGAHRLRSDRHRQGVWGGQREANERRLLAALTALGVPKAGQSITAQEVYKAVLADPAQRTHSLFYFREPALTAELSADRPVDFYESTEESRKKLSSLKGEIERAGLGPQPYDSLERLGQLVADQLWERIAQEFPELPLAPPDPLAEEQQAQDLLIRRLTHLFVGRSEELAELDRLVAEGDGYIAVTGPSGCGKTALLANWLHGRDGYSARHPGTLVISHLIGASARSADTREILVRLCQRLAPVAGWTDDLPSDVGELASAFPRMLEAAGNHQAVLIAIDALDQLEADDNAQALNWLPGTLPDGVTLIASSLSEGEYRTWPPLLARAGRRVLGVPPLGLPAAEAVIEQYLDQFHKHLSAKQLEVLGEKPDIGSPLYLQVVLNELLTFGEYDFVTDYLKGLPGTIPAMYEFVLDHLEREHGRRFVGRVMSLLACGRYGMAEHELKALAGLPNARRSARFGGTEAADEVGVTPLKWARLSRILAPHLHQRGEAIGFYHRQLQEAVARRYLAKPRRAERIHAIVAGHLQLEPNASRRKLAELPWQRLHAEDWAGLSCVLTDLAFLEAKTEAGMGHDLDTDLRSAAGAVPVDDPGRHVLEALADAYRLELPFLAAAPQCVFQALFNRLRWHEGSAAGGRGAGDDTPPSVDPRGHGGAPRVSELADEWFAGRPKVGVRPWLRALNAPRAALLGPVTRVLPGGDWEVLDLDASPDGQYLIAAYKNGDARRWRVADGTEMTPAIPHGGEATCCRFSDDGARVLTGSADGGVYVTDFVSGRREVSLQVEGRVGDCAYVPGTCLAVICHDPGVWVLWDTNRSEVLRRVPVHPQSRIYGICVSPDGELLATASHDGAVRVWRIGSGELVSALGAGHGLALACAFTALDRDRLLSISLRAAPVSGLRRTLARVSGRTHLIGETDFRPASVSVWSLARRALNHELPCVGRVPGELRVSPSGRLAAATCGNLLTVHDLAASADPTVLDNGSWLTTCAFVPDTELVAMGATDGAVRLCDLTRARANPPRDRVAHSDVRGCGFVGDGTQVLVASTQTTDLCEAQTGALIRAWHEDQVLSLDVSRDGSVAVLARGNRVATIDLSSAGRPVRTAYEHDDVVLCARMSPSGRLIASCCDDGTVRTWDLHRGQGFEYRCSTRGPANACAFSPDGERLAAVYEDGTLGVWRVGQSTPLEVVAQRKALAYACDWSAQGETLVGGYWDGEVTLCDLGSGSVQTFSTGSGYVYCCRFSPDGELLAVGSGNRMLSLWDWAAARQVAVHGQSAPIRCVAFSSDGSRILCGDEAGEARLLTAAP